MMVWRLQLKELLEGQFSTLEDFKRDSRYRVPHEDHTHASKVRPSLVPRQTRSINMARSQEWKLHFIANNPCGLPSKNSSCPDADDARDM